jgi:hypothetical protein
MFCTFISHHVHLIGTSVETAWRDGPERALGISPSELDNWKFDPGEFDIFGVPDYARFFFSPLWELADSLGKSGAPPSPSLYSGPPPSR